jgi:hypothetical protein
VYDVSVVKKERRKLIMNYCSTCEKKINENDFFIRINLMEDEFYTLYTFCSDKCKKEMYEDVEGGEPEEPYIERRYNE